jgi:hypothetical protein
MFLWNVGWLSMDYIPEDSIPRIIINTQINEIFIRKKPKRLGKLKTYTIPKNTYNPSWTKKKLNIPGNYKVHKNNKNFLPRDLQFIIH